MILAVVCPCCADFVFDMWPEGRGVEVKPRTKRTMRTFSTQGCRRDFGRYVASDSFGHSIGIGE